MCITSGSAHESSQASLTLKFLKVQSKKRVRMVQGVVVCKWNTPVCNVCLILWMLVHARARDVGVAGGSVGKSPPFPPTTLLQRQHCYNTNTVPCTTPTLLLNQHVQHDSASQGALPQVNHSNRDTAGATIPEYDSPFGPTNQQATESSRQHGQCSWDGE